jgi:predicted permease
MRCLDAAAAQGVATLDPTSHFLLAILLAGILLAAWLRILFSRTRAERLVLGAVAGAFFGAFWLVPEMLTIFQQAFPAHYFFGVSLTYGGRQTLLGDGRPFSVHWGAASAVVLVASLELYGDLTRTTYLAHLILDSCCIFIGVTSLLQSLLSQRAPAKSARVEQMRQLTDPACAAAVGLVFIIHIHHDAQPMEPGVQSIANLYHSAIAHSMLALAATQLLSNFVHAAVGFERRHEQLAQLMRSVAAFAWIFAGMVLMHMSMVLHLRGAVYESTKSLHEHWLTEHLFQTNDEGMCLYLAQICLCAALLVAVLVATRERPIPLATLSFRA